MQEPLHFALEEEGLHNRQCRPIRPDSTTALPLHWLLPPRGHWKPLHYAVQALYSPVALVAHLEEGQLHLTAINDLTDAVQLRLRLHLLAWGDDGASCQAAGVTLVVDTGVSAAP
jgi:hypothetical protein